MDSADCCAAGLLARFLGLTGAVVITFMRGIVMLQGVIFVLLSVVLAGLSVQVRAADSFPALPGGGITYPSPYASYPAMPVLDGANCLIGVWDDGVAYYEGNSTGMAIGVFSNGAPLEFPAPAGWSFLATCNRPGATGGRAWFRRTDVCGVGFTWNSSTGQCSNSDYACPVNSVMSGSGSGATCTCNAGFHASGSTCLPDPVCTAGQSVGSQTFFRGYDLNLDGIAETQVVNIFSTGLCVSGCLASGIDSPSVNAFSYAGAPSKVYATLDFKLTGSSCSGGVTPVTPDASNPCPAGYSQGLVNGVSRCLASQSSVPPAPSVTQTEVQRVDNGNGTSTVTTTTTTNNSVTTTTTIINNSTGQTVSEIKEVKKTDPDKTEMSRFCEENPESVICKTSSVAASCASFTCDGDAIQCAIAREIHARNCQLFEDRSDPVTALGDSILDGSALDANDPRSEANRVSVDLANQFNVTPRVGVVCLGDDVFEIYGSEVRLPWSALCPYLDIAGQVLVVLTLIMGMGIMFGRLS